MNHIDWKDSRGNMEIHLGIHSDYHLKGLKSYQKVEFDRTILVFGSEAERLRQFSSNEQENVCMFLTFD